VIDPEAANGLVSSWRHRRPVGGRGGLDPIGILNVLAPTHTPPPLSRPAGRKRGASCGRVFKGGKSERDCALPSKWPQHKPEAHSEISAQQQKPVKGQNGLQPLEKPLNPFDGNAPLRAFFPPLKTRPHVAVSSLSAPAGVERVGVRGGIQRKKNRNAVSSQIDNSNSATHHAQEELLKTEHSNHITRGLEPQNIQINAISLPAGSPSPNRRSSP